MAIAAFDLGGTKLSLAVFELDGTPLYRDRIQLQGMGGAFVGSLIADQIKDLIDISAYDIEAIGVAVPGIYRKPSGTVWAPNIKGWTDYPLLLELKAVAGDIAVTIDSDRAACILGELWQGNAKGCKDAIFLTVGTGIGAGILAGGQVIGGAQSIAGAIGWMAIDKAYEEAYQDFGCLETYGSGDGIARLVVKLMAADKQYQGRLQKQEGVKAEDVFEAYAAGDLLAKSVIDKCIESWGMATANLISLLNPEVIIYGGGVFGPAIAFLDEIKTAANRWAQPISCQQVRLLASALGGDACLYGAGYMAKQSLVSLKPNENVS